MNQDKATRPTMKEVPLSERPYELMEERGAENLTDAQRKKRTDQAKATLERMKESGQRWKQRMADIEAGNDVPIAETGVQKPPSRGEDLAARRAGGGDAE